MVNRIAQFLDWWALGLLRKSPQELYKLDSSDTLIVSDEVLKRASTPGTPCWVQLGSNQMLVKKLNALQKTAAFSELVESLLPFKEEELTGEVVDNTLVAITNRDLDKIRDSIKSAGYHLKGIEFPISPEPYRLGFKKPEQVTSLIKLLASLPLLMTIGWGLFAYQGAKIEKEIASLSLERSELENSTSITLQAPQRGFAGKSVVQSLEEIAESLPSDAEVTQIQLGYDSETSYLLVDLEAESALEVIRQISEAEQFRIVNLISSITPALGTNRERFRIKIQPIISGFSDGGVE